MFARGVVEADELADEVRALEDFVFGRATAHGEHAALQLLARHFGRVAVLNLEAEREHVAHERVRKPLRPLARAPVEDVPVVGQQFDPVGELVKQSRLAEARVADDRDDVKLALLEDRLKRVGHAAQLALATDHARLDALDAARLHAEGARLGVPDAVELHRLGAPRRFERVGRVDGEDAAHVPVGVVRDED